MLPLQLYYAPKSPKQALQYDLSREQDPISNIFILGKIDPSELASLNLSRSSQTILESFDTLSKRQQVQLIQKIRAEHRASQPLLPEESLEILYCDEHICVVNKPSGVLSAPGPRRNPSMADLVSDCVQPDIMVDQMIVHRLDMGTSGIIVYALTLEALKKLHIEFRDRNVQKTYQALVGGHIDGCEGEIDVLMERDPANPPYMRIARPKTAKTEESDDMEFSISKTHKFFTQAPKDSITTYRVMAHEYMGSKPVTRLELKPWTGRTHQLRVHCASALGRPILGDEIYGSDELRIPLCLHARELCINHPISGASMIFTADVPF